MTSIDSGSPMAEGTSEATSADSVDELKKQKSELEQQLTMLTVQNHALSEQLLIATNHWQRIQAELNIERDSRHNTEKENPKAKLILEQLQKANAQFLQDIENLNTKRADLLNTKSAEMFEQNLRLTANLAKKISENEQLNKQIAEMKSKHESEGEMLQRSIDALQQEKMRQQEEINKLIERDDKNMEKQTLLSDEIQRLLKQIETMERLQNVIPSTSPSPNTSRNASAMTSATISSTYNRLSMSAEGDEEEEGGDEQLQEPGEPPRKQRRMLSRQEEGQGSNVDNPGDEDDDE